MAEIGDFPLKVGNLDTAGLNDAVDAVITNGDLRRSAFDLLGSQPRLLIRRMIHLNPYQRTALDELNEDELAEILRPIRDALAGQRATTFRARLCEDVVTESPMRIRCKIEIDYQS